VYGYRERNPCGADPPDGWAHESGNIEGSLPDRALAVSTQSFAVSTHLYHDEGLSRDHLVEIAAHGFDAIELFANRPHLAYDNRGLMDQLQESLGDTGLGLHSIHAPIAPALRGGRWEGAYSIASANASAREQAVAEVQSALEIARRVPVSFLVVHVGVPDGRNPDGSLNRADAARRSIEELQRATESLGVRIALEIMPNALSTAERLVSFIEEDLEAGDIGICFDFGHAHLMGDVLDAVETASEHLVTTHVHDNTGRSDDHLLPFEGSIPWNPTLMALQKIGFEGAFVFELAASANPRQTLERAAHARQRFEALLRT
jgi:sugar phosphate isomerase/epimerase